MDGTIIAETASEPHILSKIKGHLQRQKSSMDDRTTKLWLLYMDMVDILQKGESYWQLVSQPSSCVANAPLSCCLWAQSLC